MERHAGRQSGLLALKISASTEAAEETMLLIVNASSEEEDFGWSSIVAIAEP